MSRALLVLALLARTARADEPCDVDCRIAEVRTLLERGEREAARDRLVALHAETGRPDLLFALGQVELQLEHYDAAIGYYERFIATNPGEDQVALAQQAIGAARMRRVQPAPEPTIVTRPVVLAPRYERRWHTSTTVIAAAGGVALLAGGGLLWHAHRLGNDEDGTLAEYDARQDRARAERAGGVIALGVGAITVGVALVRWRLDRTEVGRTVVGVVPAPGGTAVLVSGRW